MLVSVIIPVYNAERFIARCIASVLDQSYADIEVILVDDCSTDSTLSVLRGVLDERSDSRVRLICHDCNQGSAAARTTGINAAHGDYMVHVDCDDWIEPDFVGKMAKKAIECDADIVVCELNYIYTAHSEWKKISEASDRDEFLARTLSGDIHASLCNKLIRSSIIMQHGLRPLPGVNILDDKSMLYKVLYYANHIAYVHEPLYCYNRCNDTSYTSSSQNLNATVVRNEAAYLAVLTDMTSFFKNHPCKQNVLDGLVQFRIFVAAMLLLHGSNNIVTSYASLFEGMNMANIRKSKVPVYYKLADSLFVMDLCCLLKPLRFMLSAANKLKKHVQ